MKTQNLLQKNGMLLTVSQKVIVHPKIESNFQQVYQNQVFVIVLMHMFQLQEILLLQVVMQIQKVACKNCAPFKEYRTEINETFVDETEHINIVMPMYNLIEYSDNYSDTSGSLWQFKRDEIGGDDDLTVDAQHIPNNLPSFKYK